MGPKRLFLASRSLTISRKNINAIQVNNKIIGSDIIITSDGGLTIYATCFSKNDAKEIKGILMFNLGKHLLSKR